MSSRDVRRLAGSGHFCPPEVFHISPQLPFVLSWANQRATRDTWGSLPGVHVSGVLELGSGSCGLPLVRGNTQGETWP